MPYVTARYRLLINYDKYSVMMLEYKTGSYG